MLVVEEERVHDAVDSRRQIVDQGEAALYLLFIQFPVHQKSAKNVLSRVSGTFCQ